MLDVNPQLLRRLDGFAESFADDFRRKDQARWMAIYLRGLLWVQGRKTAETIARHAFDPDLPVADPAQALQNFVNQSPWDERKVWQRYRAGLAGQFADADGVLVVDDVVFPKKGQESVGVQRQFSSTLGRKVNCQIAVAVTWVSRSASHPLALRLYLPRNWLAAPTRLDGAGVPEDFRSPRSKGEVALELLDEARAAGLPFRAVVAGPGYGAAADFRAGLVERHLPFLVGVPDDFRGSSNGAGHNPTGPRELALAPLPSVNGSHGASPTYALASLPADLTEADLGTLWSSRTAAANLYAQMRDDVGLDHFEGRSWRGFHHHVCLAVLADHFRLTAVRPTAPPRVSVTPLPFPVGEPAFDGACFPSGLGLAPPSRTPRGVLS